jgi:uncharacterized protein YndB with AHSA1/START domain
MLETSEKSTPQSIELEYELPHSPAKVWRALTEPALVATWLMPNDLKAEVGHRFTFRSKPTAGWDGVCHCEVLEVVPPTRISYSWRGDTTDEKYGAGLDTVVSWTLTATSRGTLLRMVHSGFTEGNRFAYQAMSKGWVEIVEQRLAAQLATLN